MKYRKIVVCALTLMAALCGTMQVEAYQFHTGEKIYINALTGKNKDGGSLDWSKDNAKIVMYLWRSANTEESEWVDLNNMEYEHNDNNIRIFSGVIANERDYDRCKVIRRKYYSHTWERGDNDDKIWTETGDIVLEDIYLWNYKEGASDKGWAHSFPGGIKYAPSIYTIGTYASLAESIDAEEMNICWLVGDPVSLHCKLNAEKTAYDYSNVVDHGWYRSTDGEHWTSVDGYADVIKGRGVNELHQDTIDFLPDATNIYYYLYSSNAEGRRLLKLNAVSEGCTQGCSITSLETAISNVNADDNTFILDGIVAFGDAGGKKLIVECGTG